MVRASLLRSVTLTSPQLQDLHLQVGRSFLLLLTLLFFLDVVGGNVHFGVQRIQIRVLKGIGHCHGVEMVLNGPVLIFHLVLTDLNVKALSQFDFFCAAGFCKRAVLSLDPLGLCGIQKNLALFVLI